MKVLKGGPVETGRGFVLHSADFFIENSTLPIDEGICLTATVDILEGDRDRHRSRERDPRARLCRLGARGSRNRKSRTTAGCIALADPELIFGEPERKYDEGDAQARHRTSACCRAKLGHAWRGLTRYRSTRTLETTAPFHRSVASMRAAASAVIGSPKMIALRVFAAHLIQLDGVGIGLGAFRDDFHAEIVGQRNDRAQDHRARAARWWCARRTGRS